MPVPSAISDLSQTESSNSPGGSESPITTDNYLRTYAAFIATLRDGKGFTDPVTLASAATTDIGGQNAMFVEITGTTTITGFGTNYEGPRFLRFTGALTLTHNATTLNLPGSANITTEAGDTAIAIPNSTPNGWNVVHYMRKDLAPGTADSAATVTGNLGSGITATTQAVGDNSTKIATTEYVDRAIPLRGYIDGLIMSTAGSSGTMSIAAGKASDSTGVFTLSLAASISKTTSAWAVGTGNGGLDTGAIANSTWYYFYLIRRPDTGVVDVVFSTNSTSPTLPTNYTQFRYIGAGLTNGSAQWVKFSQDNDEFLWDAAVIDVDTVNPGTSAVTRTISVPRGRKMMAILTVGLYGGTNSNFGCVISSLDVSDQTPQVSGTAALSGFSTLNGSLSGIWIFAEQMVRTNTSAQVRSRMSLSGASDRLALTTRGWIDTRGRNA
jgi:hypothetical protein